MTPNQVWEKYLPEFQGLLETEDVQLRIYGVDYNSRGKELSLNYMEDRDLKEIFPVQFFLDRGHTGQAASFSFQTMPGCNAVVLSVHSYVTIRFRGKGLGTLLNAFRIELARSYGYSLILCTNELNNVPQRRILYRNNWEDYIKFPAKEENKNLVLSGVRLK